MAAGGTARLRARIPRARIALLTLLLAGLGLLSAPGRSPAAPADQAFRVGLFGDSVTQGIIIPNYTTEGLAPQLARDETSYGFTPGGEGLIPADAYLWKFNASAMYGFAATPPEGWSLFGYQNGSTVEPDYDGPSGYSAVTASPQATATTTVDDPDIEVLYTTTPYPATFTVTSGSRRWTLDLWRPGAATATESEIDLGPGRHQVTIHGPDDGLLTFSGLVAQEPLVAGTRQLEVDNLGHAGRAPDVDLHPRVEQSILEQDYNVTVLLYSYIGALELGPGTSTSTYEQAMLTRARLAREHGGRCLIVAPTPLPVPAANLRLVDSVDEQVARQAGCRYSTVLTHLWASPAQAIKDGLTVIDGIHPTAKGYAKMAAALAPVLAAMLGA